MSDTKHIFNEDQLDKGEFILEQQVSKMSNLSTRDVENLGYVWSYYSGRIEGNTYTYAETERLLRENITALKPWEDSVMLKNMHNTFKFCAEKARTEEPLRITEKNIFLLHTMLMKNLLDDPNDIGNFRISPVKITATKYMPPQYTADIIKKFDSILERKDLYENPLEQAVFLHCNLAKLQPFLDGNKRTARTVESTILMNNNIIPIYSADKEDIENYRDALLVFYEEGDYRPYTDYFLNKQIYRIKQLQVDQEIAQKRTKREQQAQSDLPKMPDLSKTNGMTM